MTDTLEHSRGAVLGKRHSREIAYLQLVYLNVDNARGVINQPLTEGEAIGKINKVFRARHQHSVAKAIAFDCDRKFFSDIPAALVGGPVRSDHEEGMHDAAQARILTGTDFAAGTKLSSAWWSTGMRTLASG